MLQELSPLDGAILVDKPAGPTSHDVVDVIRRHFGIKKVGHCGTLDPNATGLLIIVLGRGTKLNNQQAGRVRIDRKSTRLNSSHSQISYAVFCLKKKKQPIRRLRTQ